jgi:cytochrome c oxidase subunit 2
MGRVFAALLWLITILTVWMFVSGKWWLPPAITEHGPAYDRQFLVTIIVVGIAFTGAQVALGYMLWRYGARRSETTRGIYSHGNNRVEILCTVTTAVVFITLALFGQRVWAQLHFHEAPPGSAQVHVVAQQFQWNFQYPGADNTFGRTDPAKIKDAELNFVGLDDADPAAKDDQVVTTLVMPAGRDTELTLSSKDVTHDIWVPELRFKQDVVPGMNIKVHFKPLKTGRFELACAELCGQLHYKMKSYLIVLPEADYDELMKLPQAQFQARITELNKQPLGQSGQ